MGIVTIYDDNILVLKKKKIEYPDTLELDFNNNPDLCLTLIIACLGLGIKLIATGVRTLKYKESDRIQSLKNELLKFNCHLDIISSDKIIVNQKKNIEQNCIIHIHTYSDHRIALAFSPLVLLGYKLQIHNYEVVSKSYPNFFNDLKKFGVIIVK